MTKMKILCLHGYQQNKLIFQQKTGSFRKPLKKYADFHFLDAPNLLEECHLNKNAEDSESVSSETCDKRGWWLKNAGDGEDDGLQLSLREFEQKLIEEGPFDGVMAFSQGAAFLALACILLGEHPHFFTAIKFVIFVAGFKSRLPAHQTFYDIKDKLNIPSLHIVGDNDQMISPDRSKMLLDIFANGQLVSHPGGHYVPASKELKEVYIQFIKQFVKE